LEKKNENSKKNRKKKNGEQREIEETFGVTPFKRPLFQNNHHITLLDLLVSIFFHTHQPQPHYKVHKVHTNQGLFVVIFRKFEFKGKSVLTCHQFLLKKRN